MTNGFIGETTHLAVVFLLGFSHLGAVDEGGGARVLQENDARFECFPMAVPSLSWQNDGIF